MRDDMDHCRPLSVEVELQDTQLYATFQAAVNDVRTKYSEVEIVPTALGAILRTESELALETAVHLIAQRVPKLRIGAPSVEYIRGSELFEPVARVCVQVHGADVQRVSADAIARRGTSIAIERDTIAFDAPYSELWGYSTSLRSLTRGGGSLVSVRFLEYRPAPRFGDGDDPVHA